MTGCCCTRYNTHRTTEAGGHWGQTEEDTALLRAEILKEQVHNFSSVSHNSSIAVTWLHPPCHQICDKPNIGKQIFSTQLHRQ